MLSTLPSSSPIHRRGAQPGNNNARKHGLYSSLHPSPLTQDFEHLRQLRLLASTASQAVPIDLLERQVHDTFELLIDHFLDTDQHLGPQTTVKLDRFFRTVSVSLRLKRWLKKLRDERDFLPDLAKNALSLCTLEFTDLRISAFAIYGANQAPPKVGAGLSAIASPLGTKWYAPALPGPLQSQVPCSPLPSPVSGLSPNYNKAPEYSIVNRRSEIVNPFVPHLLQKNHTIRIAESLDSSPFDAGIPGFPSISSSSDLFVPQIIAADATDSGITTDNRQLATVNRPPSAAPAIENADYCFPLTPSQQAFLSPLLASLRAQLADMAIRQRQHPYPDLFLLQAILLRLAFHLRWSDLPPEIPIRACQLLYKQLCTSGRMQLIYHLLHRDLASHGRKNLLEMVDSGVFQHEKGRIYLTAGKPITWESFTGLLLLQRACLNQRRKKRADINERHRNGRYERERSIMRENRSRRPPSPRPSQCGDSPEAGLISALDCQTTNPILNSKLGFIPGDFPSSSP